MMRKDVYYPIMIQKTASSKKSTKPAVFYISSAVKAARLDKALSQRALSDKVGIPQGHLSKIENGDVDPRLSSVIEIARALDYEIAFVPRALLPAIQSLERGASRTGQPTHREVSAAVQDLAKVQNDIQKLARRFPESKEFQKLLTAIREIQHYKLDTRFASRIREIVEQIRPALGTLLSAQQHIKGRAETPNTQKQLQQIARAGAALRQTRNALAHGAIEPVRDSVPAYQLTAGDD
jgi:transcriptional regulator with XRE-family HTH domain